MPAFGRWVLQLHAISARAEKRQGAGPRGAEVCPIWSSRQANCLSYPVHLYIIWLAYDELRDQYGSEEAFVEVYLDEMSRSPVAFSSPARYCEQPQAGGDSYMPFSNYFRTFPNCKGCKCKQSVLRRETTSLRNTFVQ